MLPISDSWRPPAPTPGMKPLSANYGSTDDNTVFGPSRPVLRPTVPMPPPGTVVQPGPNQSVWDANKHLIPRGSIPAGVVNRLPVAAPTVQQGGYTPNPNDYNVTKDPVQKMRDIQATKAAEAAMPRADWTQLPSMTPGQLLAYRGMRRDANRGYEQMMADIQASRRAARQDYRMGARDVRRQAVGGAQDLGTSLAYSGLDTSPATMDVGVESINTSAKRALVNMERVRAQVLANARARATEARIGRRQGLSAAEAWKSNREAEAAVNNNLGRFLEVLGGG